MGLFVSISRWTPEQSAAVEKRWDTLMEGKAPKAVMDAFAKIKIIAQVTSPQNGLAVMISEVTDQTWIDGTVVCRYMADVCSMEILPACSMEQWLEVKKRLPAEQIPKK